MPAGLEYHRLFRRTLIALLGCTAAVVFCYFNVDRAVAFYMHNQGIDQVKWLVWLTLPPPVVQLWSPLVLTLLVAWRAFHPYWKWQVTLFVACLSLIVADEFRTSLGEMFGRYWPLSWGSNKLSLIGTGTYGFHPFDLHDDETGSFPSGHAARIFGFATVFWIAMPRTRLLLILVGAPMLVALVCLNYHFVSDLIAGGFVGAIVAVYATALADLRPSAPRPRFDPPVAG